MELGFDTVGNATVICYDRRPVLATDPWITGDAYFGSWTLSHRIPDEQLEAIHACEYVWFSHGHPDHLNPASLPLMRDKTILLPDHVGDRIRQGLASDGYRVRVLPDMQWVALSDRIHVLCIADYNQDGILLIALQDCLIVNINDAWEQRVWGPAVRDIVSQFPVSFLLALSGFGDANMINFYDEDGAFVTPPAARKSPVGQQIARRMDMLGTRYFVPFSSMHRYQRRDSIWANTYVTQLTDYPVGFDAANGEVLPAFVRYDCIADQVEPLHPPVMPEVIVDPAVFGDDWREPLERGDAADLQKYIQSREYLSTWVDFVRFRVGGQDTVITCAKRQFNRGVTFEVPRHSLMTAVREEIFDDLLIGNFMKTTLHGAWEVTLGRGFTPFVAKYADNGRAARLQELRRYFDTYEERAALYRQVGQADQDLVSLSEMVTRLLAASG